ncbi:MAG: T9SS type A sorting domain-containing protein [Bacteroidales bacterium]|nr:T9SS type A sorting domain-containing protein [Bacteroidales bacterium]
MDLRRFIIIYVATAAGLIFNCQAYSQQQQSGVENYPSPLDIRQDNDDLLTVNYLSTIPGIKKIKDHENRFVSLSIPGHIHSSETGKPQLPVLTRLIDFDRAEGASIRISKVSTRRIYLGDNGKFARIFPAQPGQTKSTLQQDQPLVLDKDVYSSKQAYYRDTVKISGVGIMRGKKIGRLEISPVIYYPSENYIDVIVSMKIDISYNPARFKSASTNKADSYIFEDLFSKSLLNYDSDDVIPGFSLKPAGMVIVSDTSMKSFIKDLSAWKTRKGYKVTELYIGENGLERDYQDIKDSLTYIYNNPSAESPAPTYLLLAGDLNYIPASEGTGYLSDMYYAEFDGNDDFIPEMLTGRLPAKDTTQMKSIINKILEYEKFLFGDSIKHFEKAVSAAGLDDGHIDYMDGQVNYASWYYNNNPYDTDPYIFNHENNDSIRNVRYDSLKVLMKEGVGFINYTGHGSSTEWLNTGINYSFPDEMENNSRYPVIISNACLTANYSNDNCLGSSLVRADKSGALAFIGCSNDSYWTEDFYWAVGAGTVVSDPVYEETELGFFDRLFHLNGESPSDWYTNMGQVLFAGNMAVSASGSSRARYYWETYTLLGDPSLSPYIGAPEQLNASIKDSIPPSLKTINTGSAPFAYAGLSDFDTLWDAGHTSPSGAIELDLPDIEKDSALLIITKQNGIPFKKTIYFVESDTAWMSLNSVNITDANGNNNDRADYGENIGLVLDFQNAGNEDASNVYAKIASNSEYLDIQNDSVFIGTVSGNTESTFNGFSVLVNDSIPDMELATINIDLYYNGNEINQVADFSLHAPEPLIINCTPSDEITGNGNGLIEPGERVSLTFRITNTGSASCKGTLLLGNISPMIDFDQTSLTTGTLYPGITAEIEVYADISPETPDPSDLNFDAELVCTPYETAKTLGILVGKTAEDFELQKFTTFPWINNSDKPWTITDMDASSNVYSARSGEISDNQESVLTMLISIPEEDTLSFWYRVSSENSWDFFNFQKDSINLIHKSGEVDWNYTEVVLEKGAHLLQWIYKKDGSVYAGSDCAFLDYVKFPVNTTFIRSAVSFLQISSPESGKNYSDETLTVKMTNLGRDTIPEISMAYKINDSEPVEESFILDFNPGDTTEVSFGQTIDMSSEGTYDITVYFTPSDYYYINDTTYLSLVSTGIGDTDPQGKAFTLAPNPVRNNIRLLSSINSDQNTFLLYNSSGTNIFRKEIPYISSGEQIFLYPGKLAKGTYILVVITPGKKYHYKLIKM